jgi:carboxyl-terminal processing protease
MNNERIDKYTSPSGQPSKRPSNLQPLYFAGTLIVGLLVGTFLADQDILTIKTGTEENPNKLVSLIDFIEDNYVDSVDKRKLIDDAIGSILKNLDPHSYYLSPEELAGAQEQLEGGFEGIGVEFMILRDTLMVVKTVDQGPSQKAGLMAGDRIVKVDEEPMVGDSLDSDKAQKMLKGKRGSKVNVEVVRPGAEGELSFTITRGNIPLESVPAAFMVNDSIGYVKVERFARTTYSEFKKATDELKEKGCRKLILDLRGNGGGLMDQATGMVEEFLTEDKLIVYTTGAHSGKEVTLSNKDGDFKKMDVIVMIDQNSASASEIVAGALQDWDRSITIGRRSFGKGLVQHEIELPDNSALRLTVARYHTPTGRCIQRPYGDSINYDDDFHDRISSGELMSEDSIRFPDSLKFTTPKGRVVYGGGGIMPDIFVPLDTTYFSGLLGELSYTGLLREYTFDYVDKNRQELKKYQDADDFIARFNVSESMMAALVKRAQGEKMEVKKEALRKINAELKVRIKAQIARSLYNDTAMYKVLLSRDNDYKKALEVAGSFQKYALK